MIGPTRGEHVVRLVISLVGLGLTGVALATHGIANVAALVEVAGIAGLFFGASAAFSGWRLWKGPPG